MTRSLLVAALLAIGLSACGDKPAPVPAPTPAPAPAPAPEAPKADAPVAAPAEAPKADAPVAAPAAAAADAMKDKAGEMKNQATDAAKDAVKK